MGKRLKPIIWNQNSTPFLEIVIHVWISRRHQMLLVSKLYKLRCPLNLLAKVLHSAAHFKGRWTETFFSFPNSWITYNQRGHSWLHVQLCHKILHERVLNQEAFLETSDIVTWPKRIWILWPKNEGFFLFNGLIPICVISSLHEWKQIYLTSSWRLKANNLL